MGKNNYQKPMKRFQRYGIRKFSQGVASVMIASGMFFLSGGMVSANEITAQTDSRTTEEREQNPKKVEEKATEASVETKKQEITSLDKTKLENYIKEITTNIESGKYDSKTEESVANLKAEVEAAKSVVVNAKTQEELTKAYNKLVTTAATKLVSKKQVEKKETPAVDTTNGQATVGKKADNTEPVSASNSIANTGKNDERNGKEIEAKGSQLRSADEGYTSNSTELRKENGEFATATGKSYKVLDGNDQFRVYVHGYQSENTDVKSSNNGRPDVGGRTDIPLSKTEAKKIADEALLWRGKVRASGRNNNNNTWGAGGPYEYLTTEIYGYTYEQGTHYVYITDVKKRFSLSKEAEAAGYSIKKIDLSNLIPGTGYNEKTDTVEGYAASNLQNGVYDMRYILTIEKDGQTQQVAFRDLTAGWIGWQDSTAPYILGTSKMVTIGDEVEHDIKYADNETMNKDERAGYAYTNDGSKVLAGSKTAPNTSKKATFTAIDGTKISTMSNPLTVNAHTALNGVYTGKDASITDVIPGLNYNPTTGKIHGTASEAGIYTVAALGKDYNNSTNATNIDWNMDGQEAHENITIAVAPKITVSNVEAYATKVPVSISQGANAAEITMPDGTVTKLEVKNGNWTVAEGTTNTAVNAGDVLGAASTSAATKINLPVTSDATQYVGIDSIAAKAMTDKVRADIQREIATVKDAAGKSYTATFNRATGKYTLANEDAYVLKDNGDGTSTLTERRVYTDIKGNGDVDFIVYEFTRTWSATSSAADLIDKVAEIRKKGEVKAVGDVTRTVTPVVRAHTADKQGLIVTVTYDSATKQWTASDGSTVTAKESGAGWDIQTDSGFKGYVSYRSAEGVDLASIQNDKPTGTSTSYAETKDTSVDLLKSTKATVAFEDVIDDKSTDAQSETITTKLTVTAPDGTKKEFNAAQAEETAYIQAQRTAAEKTQAAAAAIENAKNSENEVARLQEQVDRQEALLKDAETALANLKLRTISATAKDLAEKKIQAIKEYKASLDGKLAEAKTALPGLTAKVASSRQEALEAEKAVEAARTALKTKATENLSNPEVAAYTLGQYGSYKVTVRAVDSNGVVTTPTVGTTDSGEVTEDAVAETTYYIVVSKPEKSAGAQGKEQTDTMETGFKAGLPTDASVADYKLVDPVSGKKTDSVTTEEGTYTIDGTTGAVSFTPAPDFIGTAKPLTVAANVTFNGEDGQPVTVESSTTYTPTVYGVKPKDDETTGKQGQVQTSIPGSERFSALNTGTNTPDNTNVDWTTAKYSLEGANEEGKVVVEGEGTYAIEPATGAVTFTPEPSFKGQAKGVEVKVSVTATDSEGNKVEVTSSGDYTPEVEAVEPTAEPKKTSGKQGQPQTQDTTTMFKEGDTTAPIEKSTIKLVDPTGAEVTTLPATKDGKTVGTYTIDPTTGVITFQPNKDFTGTPEPAKVVAADKNGTKVETTYTPTVTPVEPEGQDKTTTGYQGKPQTGTVTFTEGDPEFPIDNKVPATFEDGTTRKEVPGEGVYTVAADGTVTFVPENQFTGTAKGVTVKRVDTNGTPATAKYTPIVIPVVPEGFDNVTTGVQGETQNGKPYFKPGREDTPINENVPPKFIVDGQPTDETTIPAKTPGGKEIGTYTINPQTGVITFTPTDKTYVGLVQPATVQRQDTNGTKVPAEYTPVIVGVKPTAKPATSEDVQGVEQSKEVTFAPGKADVNGTEKSVAIDPASFKLLGENGQPADSVPAKNPAGDVVGTYTLKVVDGKATAVFTPTNKTYVGTVQPVTIQAADTNGTTVKTTYTPNITPIKPTATPAKTTDIQGKAQFGTPTFTAGDSRVPIVETSTKLIDPVSGKPVESVTVDGEGTYTIEPNGSIKFQPEPQFTGKATGIEVQRLDENGTPAKAKYTPTVTPVKPTGEDVKSEDIQGAEQKGTPVFKPGNPEVPITINAAQPVKLIDLDGNPADSVTVEGEGTYTVNPTTGEVTFTPKPEFTGVATGVSVQVKDANGTPVEARYTPKVKGVTPTAKPAKSKDIQGAPQTGKPEFVGGKTTINGVEKTVEIDENAPAKLIDPKTGKPTTDPVVVEGEGTYTVAPDGTVTFTPEKTFTGTATGVTVQRYDKNGTPAEAKYTPTVVGVSPEGEDTTSVGPKNTPQSGTPTFTGGTTTVKGVEKTVEIDNTVPAKLVDPKTGNSVDTVTVPGEGTYTVTPEGVVTFTPEKDFVGEAKGVTVKRVDKNGLEATANYTPTVLGETKTKDVTSEGAKNQPQSGTPVFEGDVDKTVPPTFEGGETTKVVPGEGTYTITPEGEVTFTPEQDYVGTGGGIVVVRKDVNGKNIYAKYTPTVRPDTEFVDENGNPIKGYPSVDGTVDKKDIPEYRYVETVTDGHGNTRHIYRQVVTFFKDKEGKEIPNYPAEKGTTPKKDNVPEYRFVETKKLPNGDTEHVYEKVKTSFKDKEGKEIPNYPTEEGEQPKKDIPGYRFVTTNKLPNGDIEHIYEKEISPTPTPQKEEKVTTYVDEKGNPIRPTKNGEHPSENIPEFELVRTEKDAKGNVRHVYRKVTTPTPETSIITTFVDENGKPILPNENGEVPAKDIPGYELVRTEKDAKGNVRHIYKVATPVPVPQEKVARQELPNTGTGQELSIFGAAASAILAGLGLVVPGKKKEEKEE